VKKSGSGNYKRHRKLSPCGGQKTEGKGEMMNKTTYDVGDMGIFSDKVKQIYDERNGNKIYALWQVR